MITYGGIPLEPTTAATQAAGAWFPFHRLDEFEYQSFLVPGVQHLPTPFFPKREEPRIGVLNWPPGADRFATCFLTATLPELTAIRTLLGTAPTEQALIFNDGAGGDVTAPMYLIGTHPISQRGDGAEFYLLVFVDERYFWWMSGGAATPTVALTWASLFTQMFTSLGVDVFVGTVPPAYLTPNMNRWNCGVQPLPIVISAAALTTGLRVVRTRAGTVSVDDYTTAAQEDQSRWNLIKYECLAGGQISGADIARGLPAQVDTVFFNGVAVPTTLVSLALPLAEGVEGVDSRVGRVTADPADPTAGEQTAYSDQAALDYYNWAFSVTDATFRGFLDIEPCGLDEAVEWVHTPDTMVTRILRPPWADRNIYGEANASTGSGSCSGCQWVQGLLTTDCLRVGLDGVDSDLYLKTVDRITWNNGPQAIVICGTAWAVAFTRGACDSPCLTLTTSTSGGDVTYTGMRTCCECAFADFAFARQDLCPDSPPLTTCSNIVTVRVTLSCCPITGWGGAGWYCIEDTGPDDCTAQELLDADKCDTDIVICSGPYATEADALAVCPAIVLVPSTCFGVTQVPASWNVTLTGVTNTGFCADCTALNTTHNITPYFDATCKWLGFTIVAACTSPSAVLWQLDVIAGPTVRLRLSGGGGTDWFWTAPVGAWDFVSPLVLTLVAPQVLCDTMPGTVTIIPA